MSFGAQAPDYTGAAEKQGQSSVNAINAQTQANRPNINTPWGSQSWTHDQNGNWTMNTTLAPDQQAALDSQMKIGAGKSAAAQGLLGQATQDMSKGIDWGSIPGLDSGEAARTGAVNAAYDSTASRLNPQWQQYGTQNEADLLAKGLSPGSEAYDAQMGNFNRGRTDAYQQANNGAELVGDQMANSAFQRSLQARQQGVGEAYQKQYGSLNALNALLSGSQVSMPNMPSFQAAGAAQPTNYLGAAGMTGQFDLANAQMQNQLASSAISGGANLGSKLFML